MLKWSFLSWFQIGWRFIANIFAFCLCKYFLANDITQKWRHILSKCTSCNYKKLEKGLWKLWLLPPSHMSMSHILYHAILKGKDCVMWLLCILLRRNDSVLFPLTFFFFFRRMCALARQIKVGDLFWVELQIDSNTFNLFCSGMKPHCNESKSSSRWC